MKMRHMKLTPKTGRVDTPITPDTGAITLEGRWAPHRTKRKFREPGRKPYREEVTGYDHHRDSDRLRKVERIIDRERDWYSETLTDPETGQIVRSCEEPLSKHRDRGLAARSGKKKK